MSLTITWLGSASFQLEDSFGHIVFIDPWLDSDDPPKLDPAPGNPGCPIGVADVEKADYVLVTHGDPAHYGRGDSVRIAARTGARYVTNRPLSEWIVAEGLLPRSQLVPLEFHKRYDLGILEVSMFPVIHPPYDSPEGKGVMGEPNTGFAVRFGGTSIIYAGDTVLGDEVYRTVAEKYQPVVGLFPINPTDSAARGTVSESVELAASIVAMTNVKYVIPHYRFKPSLTGVDALPNAVEALGAEAIQLSAPGESFTLPT